MADIQKERDERTEKTPTSQANQGDLRKDDASKKDENRGAGTPTGKQDSNLGRSSSGNMGSQSGSAANRGTSQTPGRDVGADKDKGGNQSGMKR